jgi:EmrB/QacA subfamily drug resistance transporter
VTEGARTEPTSAPAPYARRWWVLSICCLSLLLVGLDTTVVNVALPAIHRDLHASLSGLQWIVDAYTLVIASFLMLSGSTADRLGRKRVFMTGISIFAIGSAACAAAPNLDILVAARVLQALGGSMLNPVALSIVRDVFTDPRERAQAVGLWGAMVGFSIALGPVIGGVFVDTIGWRYVFLVNVPIGVIAWLLTAAYVPESRAAHARRIDPVGQILVIFALATLTFGIIEGGTKGWTSPVVLASFAVALSATVTFVPYELRRFEPLVEPRFFRSAPFAGASAIATFAFACFSAFLFLNNIYLQEARGYSALKSGLFTLPVAALVVILPPVSGRLVGRRGNRPSLVLGGLGLMVGPLLLSDLQQHTSIWRLLAAYVAFGIGHGFINAPITNTAISGMPPSQTGVAAAIASTSRQVGATIGIALGGALVAGGSASASTELGPQFASATHTGWWMIFGFAAAVFTIGLITTTGWASHTAKATAARLEPEGALT